MRTRIVLPLLAALLSCLTAASSYAITPVAESVRHHTAPCFAPAQNVNCEVSGVVRSGDQLILVNDKQMPSPGSPAVFTLRLDGQRINAEPVYLPGETLRKADKYEALTSTLDGRYILASTAFNKEGTAQKPELDALNTLLYWPQGAPEQAKVLAPSSRGGVTSSRGLRDKISQVIGSPYFQVEALTITPDKQLLVGIRKHGQNSKVADFSFLLLAVPLIQEGNELTLGDSFTKVLDLKPEDLTRKLGLPDGSHPELGISGIEYDRYSKNRFYAVTSFEKENTLGGYLWVLPLEQGKVGQPQPVKGGDGKPVAFANKPEGVEILDRRHVLVVHDDDRVKVKPSADGNVREDHEFAYSVVTLTP